MTNMVELNIPKSSAERAARSFINEILRQFNGGALNIEQATDELISGFARSQQSMAEIFAEHKAAVAHARGRTKAGNDISGL
jgi:hypothetical protein